MIRFILNDKVIETNFPQGSSLLDFVRYEKQLSGTKIGCREGDCGACTILVGDFQDEKLAYQSMTSCITPLGNAHGKHILTIEGLNSNDLIPAQALMVENNGTQCGFCTPGFIVSMAGFTLSDERPEHQNAVKAIDGNICRCTGYKSIERATEGLCQTLKDRPTNNKINWLVEHGHLPKYMLGISDRLKTLMEGLQNTEFDQASNPDIFIGGGTDLLVQKPEAIRKVTVNKLFNDPGLNKIEKIAMHLKIGAAVTVTDLENSKLFNTIFPDLTKYFKLISSTPIRNMATIGGNFVNASPIGDMSIFFLALNSQLTLTDGKSKRVLSFPDFFLDYKKLDKKPSEHLESISFPVLQKNEYFNFEKVSKRTHLDIASVNSACRIKLDEKGIIHEAFISAGGIAPIPKFLKSTSEFLVSKKPDFATLQDCLKIVQEEVSPISDARGTSDYKRLLLRQLILAHFLKMFGPLASIQTILTNE